MSIENIFVYLGCVGLLAVILALGGCGLQLSAPSEEQLQAYHEKAEEALAVAQGIYFTGRDIYQELRAAGEIDDEKNAKILAADEKLKAAYFIAKDAIDSAQGKPTIQRTLRVVLAMADGMITELSGVVDNDALRTARIALIVLRRLAVI